MPFVSPPPRTGGARRVLAFGPDDDDGDGDGNDNDNDDGGDDDSDDATTDSGGSAPFDPEVAAAAALKADLALRARIVEGEARGRWLADPAAGHTPEDCAAAVVSATTYIAKCSFDGVGGR